MTAPALSSGDAALSAFLADVPLLDRFQDGIDPGSYRAFPDDWFVAVADVAASTGAIQAGNYKSVNMVGAGVITALFNACKTRDLPFVFGGDGASLVVPPQFESAARTALAAMQCWSRDEMGLALRAAIIPVHEIRRLGGADVRMAFYRSAAKVRFAMFQGDGMAWADASMKAGHYAVAPSTDGAPPDLTGLSCRWQPAEAQHGQIVSLIVVPLGARGDKTSATNVSFTRLQRDILAIVRAATVTQGRPVTRRNLRFTLRPKGYDLEARARFPAIGRRYRRLRLKLFASFAWMLFRFNLKSGSFDPALYQNDLVANTDFRKFDDGLKLTIDCPETTVRQLTELLDAARSDGVAAYGLHRQSAALITCLVPSYTERDHIHFVDGAGGGYALAAAQLKASLKAC
ncbi:MAG: DUF3095 domain-containing protein [Pseudomonadota bacterium]